MSDDLQCFDQVLCERQGAVARVTISNPGKFNAMSRRMWRELATIFRRLQSEPGLRCILLRGHDGHFCAGGDISEYPGFRFTEEGLREFHENDVWSGLQAMLDCDVPILARIEGNCMGAGVELACCCDLRISTESARFGAPIGRLGFPIAPRELQLVAREAGLPTVRSLLLEGTILGAARLHAQGFLHQMVADGALDRAVDDTIDRICAQAPAAARLNKQALRALSGGAPAWDALLDTAYRYASHDEHRDGIDSFLAKRAARFSQTSD